MNNDDLKVIQVVMFNLLNLSVKLQSAHIENIPFVNIIKMKVSFCTIFKWRIFKTYDINISNIVQLKKNT